MANAHIGESQRCRLRRLFHCCCWRAQASAQEGQREEIVVTGSYIKRDTFDAPSPTEVFDGGVIQQSGAPSMGIVHPRSHVHAEHRCGRERARHAGRPARFGVGELQHPRTRHGQHADAVRRPSRRESTAAGSIVAGAGAASASRPCWTAARRLYGTDAVAGVVNLIPVKKFNGFKTRSLLQPNGGQRVSPAEVLDARGHDVLRCVGCRLRGRLHEDERRCIVPSVPNFCAPTTIHR